MFVLREMLKSFLARQRFFWGTAATCALLVACGGGDQVKKFEPVRVLSFGDENSVITSSGQNYSINGLNADKTAIDCGLNRVWNQILANSYGLNFPQCAGTATVTNSRILAVPMAKVADVKAQIDQFVTTDRFGSNDLVSVLVGQNDLWAQYALYNGSNELALITAMEAAGVLYAEQVNRMANAGARVIVSTIPDQSLTPFALAEKAASTDTDRAALIKRLMRAFHLKLRITLINDGNRIGLVLADELTQQIAEFPANFSYTNINTAACLSTAVLPNCTSATLVSGADAGAWLWSDATHLSAGGHSRLGEAARARATGNPF
ncbi:MAG: esterase [Rhizobacter sp.]